MKDSLSLKFLYRTALGRMLLKSLVQPKFSKLSGAFLSSPISKYIISGFIKKHQIDMSRCIKTDFNSFNDFFKREMRYTIDFDEQRILNPCDAFLSTYHITENSRFQIKNSWYTLSELLNDADLAKNFSDGTICIFRLEPCHYHRYIYPIDGTLQTMEKIQGVFHCVRPIATEQYPVYIQNTREYAVIQNSQLGTLIQMEVGALMVGKIHNHAGISDIQRGTEKGYFEYGGSTIILLFQKDKIVLDNQFLLTLNTGIEIPVKIGESFAKSRI